MINQPLERACKVLEYVCDCPSDHFGKEHPGGCDDVCRIVNLKTWACWYQYFEGEMQSLRSDEGNEK